MVELLGRIGLVVIVAETGPQCLNLARDSQPDLVLLDVSMPGMNGWEVAQELRNSVSPSSRIVMLSGNAHEIDTHRDSAKHHDAEHIKPFIADSLLQTLGELLDLEWILLNESLMNSDAVAAAAGEQRTTEILPSLRELDDLTAR
jgi:CheY-like chemotaxis protein